jgi:hypothetical protein
LIAAERRPGQANAAQQGERVRIIRVRARLLLGEAKRRLQLARQQQ